MPPCTTCCASRPSCGSTRRCSDSEATSENEEGDAPDLQGAWLLLVRPHGVRVSIGGQDLMHLVARETRFGSDV